MLEQSVQRRAHMIKRLITTIITVTMLLSFILVVPTKAATVTHPKVEIQMDDGSTMVFELYPEYAPETVANFLSLTKSGFYDGLKFHRIIADFMIQGGDPAGDGTGGSGKNIPGEFLDNQFSKNTLRHTKGVISMARSSDPNSASSQFFIMLGDIPQLDGQYAAFGKLVEGEKTLDAIGSTPVSINPLSGEMSLSKTDIVIKKVTIEEVAQSAESKKTIAAPTKSNVIVDGKTIAFEAYNINESNYFKLRDIAMAIKETNKKFEIDWDKDNNAMSLTTGKAYSAIGGELSIPATSATCYAQTTTSKIYLNGSLVSLTAYNIGDNNYFKLRDVAAALNFGATWDSGSNTIGIDTTESYLAQ